MHRGKLLREPLAALWDKRRALPPYARDFCEFLAAHMREVFSSLKRQLQPKRAAARQSEQLCDAHNHDAKPEEKRLPNLRDDPNGLTIPNGPLETHPKLRNTQGPVLALSQHFAATKMLVALGGGADITLVAPGFVSAAIDPKRDIHGQTSPITGSIS